jgi:glucosamine--fructose-6-phosphate aminotransferase (isomerizing)
MDGRAIRGQHTVREIRTQTESWEDVFHQVDAHARELREMMMDAEEIIFAGCGSSFNISHSVAPFFQELAGASCRAVHASDLVINPRRYINRNRRTLAVIYSRSGNTTESVLAVREARARGCATLAIVTFADSTMAHEASRAVVLEGAVEKSVTTTRSFTAMVLTGYYLAAVCAEDAEAQRRLRSLPGIARERMNEYEELGKTIGSNDGIKKYAFLGSGTLYGLARECQLKVKEMVLLPSDSYVTLDFQHGPMSNVDEHMLVTVLESDAGHAFDMQILRNMKALGGKTFLLCDREGSGSADYLLTTGTGLADGYRDILYMPPLQFAAYHRSLSVGCDPDNPKNLSYYVQVDHDSEQHHEEH